MLDAVADADVARGRVRRPAGRPDPLGAPPLSRERFHDPGGSRANADPDPPGSAMSSRTAPPLPGEGCLGAVVDPGRRRPKSTTIMELADCGGRNAVSGPAFRPNCEPGAAGPRRSRRQQAHWPPQPHVRLLADAWRRLLHDLVELAGSDAANATGSWSRLIAAAGMNDAGGPDVGRRRGLRRRHLPLSLIQRRASWPGGRVAVRKRAAPRKVRAPQGRVVGNTDPG